MVSFAWPWIFLLAPLPLLVSQRFRKTSGSDGIDVPPRVSAALSSLSSGSRPGIGPNLVLNWVAWLLLLTALAQPSVTAGQSIEPATGRAIVLALDLSTSMEREDFVLDGKKVDRLVALKSVAEDFIVKRAGDRIGLVLFGDRAFSAAPVSYDLAAIANAVQEAEIGMAGRTTAIGEAVGLAIVKLKQDTAAEKAIVLLSDGTNNSGGAEPEDAAELAGDLGIRIHTIGMGSERADGSGSPIDPSADLDEATLKRVADISGGQFFRARTTEELAEVYTAIDRLEASEAKAPPFVPRTDIRNWVLAALAATLVLLSAARLRWGAA